MQLTSLFSEKYYGISLGTKWNPVVKIKKNTESSWFKTLSCFIPALNDRVSR
jgi:hypothetical protein